ncbi:MAG: hypothetical protein ABEJ24_05765 [Candidatus Magasanikbacteria bacterium]
MYWSNKKLYITALSLALILIGAGCSSSPADNSNTSADSGSDAKAVERAAPDQRTQSVKVGSTISNGHLAVTLQEIRRVDKVSGGQKGLDFLLLKVKYENVSESKIKYDNSGWGINNFYKKGIEGNPPSVSIPPMSLYSSDFGVREELQPGKSASGWTEMRIPEELEDFSLKYSFFMSNYDFNGDGEYDDVDVNSYPPALEKGVWEVSNLKTESSL